MTTSKQHRKTNLSFKRDHPDNSEIVNYFYAAVERDGCATVGVKHEAIRRWGFSDAIAGMYRAFRRYRRTH